MLLLKGGLWGKIYKKAKLINGMELDLEAGIEQAVEMINRVNERPILVAIFGHPNSGKSHLIDRLGDRFEELSVARHKGGPCEYTFKLLNERPNYLKDLQLFHCGWERKEGKSYERTFKSEDPNILARDICGRELHLNIGIYNPAFSEELMDKYDFVICNTNSVRK